ncbi:basic amino acid ABC transporter substrate-binding protein [Paenibacillus kobensis]|uniref:basic amino acid ABC transporter substrate-binding protein n=1 Tax=Paenibacillus kobensis TaxID=59841 RepID=UPI000FDB58D7|nr:basic amino acid ABC transporter substrate-binding protein [Paenibacillus kobensis]
MGKRNRWLMLAAAVLLLAAVVGCGSNDKNGGEKTYKIATDASYAPMEMMDKDQIVGFDIDFLAAVMKEAGLSYKVVNVGWDALMNSLLNGGGGEYDAAISAVSITSDREQSYDFTVPYFESTNMILTKEGSGIKSATDLVGKKVAVQGATTADTLMSGIMGQGSADLKRFDSNALALLELDNNGVDAVVADIAVVGEYVRNNPDKHYEGIVDRTNFASEFYGILLPTDSELKAKLDPAIKKVIESGEYAAIYEKWLGKKPDTAPLLKPE